MNPHRGLLQLLLHLTYRFGQSNPFWKISIWRSDWVIYFRSFIHSSKQMYRLSYGTLQWILIDEVISGTKKLRCDKVCWTRSYIIWKVDRSRDRSNTFASNRAIFQTTRICRKNHWIFSNRFPDNCTQKFDQFKNLFNPCKTIKFSAANRRKLLEYNEDTNDIPDLSVNEEPKNFSSNVRESL